MFYKVMDLGKKAKASLWEILRCLFHAAVIAFLLSCMIFQAILFMDHLEMKQRLAEIERATPKTLFTTTVNHRQLEVISLMLTICTYD